MEKGRGYYRALALFACAASVAGCTAAFGSAAGASGAGVVRLSGGSRSGAEVTIRQTVNFHQPVESPGDLARRMESVNQALGEWMSQEG
jgi:hypothetical protein